jgi:hypothetical protein
VNGGSVAVAAETIPGLYPQKPPADFRFRIITKIKIASSGNDGCR